MVAEPIEKLKREYTDKYVVVDGARPELARFRDTVGRVKTVNMSGRALVEFMDYHLNIGWYDIDLEFLKVVDKPAPKVEKPAAKKAEAKPQAAAKAPAPVAKAQAVAKPQVAGKMSVAEMMAAARGGKAAAPAPAKPKPEVEAKPQAEVAPVEETESEAAPAAKSPAEAPPVAAKPAGKVDRTKMSVAEMLAHARQSDKKS